MVEVEIKENKKIAYNDILQYGGGLRLARGLSTRLKQINNGYKLYTMF